jgi:hypothetical protein
MSTDLANPQHSVRDLEVMASRVAKSRLFNMDESQAFTLMLLCQSRGIHPIEAVMRYDIIQGRPAMKSDAMLAEFQRIGGSVDWLSDNDNPDYAEAVFSHPKLSPKPKRVKFSMKDAHRAGLDGKDSWKKYPYSMLRARVVSMALRMLSPGIVSGIYTPEEVGDMDEPRKVEATASVKPLTPEVVAVAEAARDLEVKDWAARKVAEQTARYQPPEAPSPAEPVAPGEDPYQAHLFATVQRVNDYWSLHHTSVGLPEPKDIVNLFQVENHLGNWAEQNGRIKPDYLIGLHGTRSRTKLKNFLGKWYGKYREEFERLTEEYLSEKLEEAMKKAGLAYDPEDGHDPEDCHNPADDWDVPADVVESVDGGGSN